MQPGDLNPHLQTQLGVEVREWLIEQEDTRMTDNRPANRHALPLSARERARQAIEQFGEMQTGCRLSDRLVDLRFGLFHHLQRIGQIAAHRHVGVERIGLKHHRDAALGSGLLCHVLLLNQQLSAADLLQPGNHPQ